MKNKKFIKVITAIFIIGLAPGIIYEHTSFPPHDMQYLDVETKRERVYIQDYQYEDVMRTIAEPYLKGIQQEGYFKNEQGHMIHYADFNIDNPKGNIVMLHGFNENIIKYYETIYYFCKEGYSVHMLEQVGHGKSDRLVDDNSLVYVDSFDEYVESTKLFIDKIVVPAGKGKPLFLYAHSMGGAIGTLFLERYPTYFNAAILSTPMMEINAGTYPAFIAEGVSNVMALTGNGEDYVFGHTPFSDEANFKESNGDSEVRYNYYFNKRIEDDTLQTTGASFKWTVEAYKATRELNRKSNIQHVDTPTIIFVAENDGMVKPGGIYEYMKYVSDSTSLIYVKDTKHEIYNSKPEIREAYYDTILDFYNKHISRKTDGHHVVIDD